MSPESAFCPRDDDACEYCPIPRALHDTVVGHDFQCAAVFVCGGCAPDVVWDVDNIESHPSHDHDFDPRHAHYESAAPAPSAPDDRDRERVQAALREGHWAWTFEWPRTGKDVNGFQADAIVPLLAEARAEGANAASVRSYHHSQFPADKSAELEVEPREDLAPADRG